MIRRAPVCGTYGKPTTRCKTKASQLELRPSRAIPKLAATRLQPSRALLMSQRASLTAWMVLRSIGP